MLFFRLNLPSIYQFAQDYITLLDNNLIYFEDRIINDIVLVVVGIVVFFSLLMLHQAYTFHKINLYEQRILMLISRVSMQEAERMVQM